MNINYSVNGVLVSVAVEGDTSYGEDTVLLDQDDDLSAGNTWHDVGYVVDEFLSDDARTVLVDGILGRLIRVLRELGHEVGDDFRFEDYHTTFGADEAEHARFVEIVRKGFPLEEFPIDLRLVEGAVSELCGVSVVGRNADHGIKTYHVRVVRPRSRDNNPLHRDVWLDRLRNGLNIYFPLAGSSALSSLCLVPGSHRWKESEICRTLEGASVDGLRYTVPAVVGAKKELDLIRPDPRPDQVLLFSPYLIHGGAVNLDPARTRVSLEMRFWRR